MFVRRSKIPAGQFAVALAVVIGVGLSAGEAGPTRHALPAPSFSLASYPATADTAPNASLRPLTTSDAPTTPPPANPPPRPTNAAPRTSRHRHPSLAARARMARR